MYRYSPIDQRFVKERVAQYRNQTQRFLAGELTEDEFRPLRLQNGLYIQRHGPMLRIAIPYGVLSALQLRTLARITRTYDRGWGHFSTRQNLQLNWLKLEQTPDILAELAEVDMHAIQTSGNCVRNITADPLAGVSPQHVADPRPWAEILRQWAALHPEFSALPRKFKFSVSGGADDGACGRVHDIGLRLVCNAENELGFAVIVGGGLGRTPVIGQVIREFLPWQHLLTYSEAVMRIYNLYGRRDNLYKARIKILVRALGVDEFTRQVEAEWAHLKEGPQTLTQAEVERISAHFQPPPYETLPHLDVRFESAKRQDANFARWVATNVHAHAVPGYAAVTLSLKLPGKPPGDASAEQMEAAAAFSEDYGFGEIRATQTQNLLLPDVRLAQLYDLWQAAKKADLATAGIGLINDITCCPGGDLCSLANARSIPLALSIQERFADLAAQADIGKIKLNISGCMNACGHHHVGNIGILGVDKHGEEFYQITLGGQWGEHAAIGRIIGPAVSREEAPAAVERIINEYRRTRLTGEHFLDTLQRLGLEGFRSAVYAQAKPAATTALPARQSVEGAIHG